jgi:membrane-bound lytic murein transglycosylase D
LINSSMSWLRVFAFATVLAPLSLAQTPASGTLPGNIPAVQTDPIAVLIAQADQEFKAGQDNYQAGHLAAARQNFDRAFNLLLESPFDMHSDDRLQREFDRIVDGASTLELKALEQGDGFTEQKSEPAPIDEANEVTFPADPNVKAQAEAQIKSTQSDLPLMLTDPVVSYLNYFSKNGKGTLERGLIRAGRYEPMIRRVLKEEGVPQDLIYLAQAESGFHEQALSRAGARGMWQFISSRASGYGLERNWWLDERLDPEKSTRAAARHLHDLYNQFGDWYLAMAAYNSGPGNVQQAVRRTGYADFWELYRRDVLPRETKNYVPIIVAVTILAKNRAHYGLDDIVPDPPQAFDTVKINYPVDLRLVAECVDVPVSVLQDLNPSLLRTTTPKDAEFDLHLPLGSKDNYETAIAAIPEDMRVWWRYHRVAPGETLASLARTYRTPVASIAEANGLPSEVLPGDRLSGDRLPGDAVAGGGIQPDAKLIIPIAEGKMIAGETGDLYSKHAFRYHVRRGDTVVSVAQNFGVPPEKVRSWNHIRGNSLHSVRTVRIYLPLVAGREKDAAWTGGKTGGKTGRKMKTASSRHHARPATQKSKAARQARPGEAASSLASDVSEPSLPSTR